MSLIDIIRKTTNFSSLFDYDEEKIRFNLTFVEAVSLIVLAGLVIFSLIAPLIIHVPRGTLADTGLTIDPSRIALPLTSYKHLLGTDVYGRDIIDLFLLGLNKTYLAAIICTAFHGLITVPIAIYSGMHMPANGFFYKLIEPVTLFPAIFVFVMLSGFADTSLLVIYIAVFLSTLVYIYSNTYRAVAQVLQARIMHTLHLDGATHWHIYRLIILPKLIPNLLRLLRRTFIIVVTELIVITALQINMNPLGVHWGTIINQAWYYNDYTPHALFIMLLLVAVSLYCNSKAFMIAERYLRDRFNQRPVAKLKH